jgi:hypothetical protein
MITLGVSTFVLIILLPAILERKKPKDAGPRMVKDYTFTANLVTKEAPIVNLEEKQEFDQTLIKKTVDAINTLPSLEV